eukprot:1857146-Prymnesium_polylepis.2
MRWPARARRLIVFYSFSLLSLCPRAHAPFAPFGRQTPLIGAPLPPRQLVELLEESIPGAAGQVKGGQSSLRSLDTAVYRAEARPKALIADFGKRAAAEQVTTLGRMFELLDLAEKQMVVAQMA